MFQKLLIVLLLICSASSFAQSQEAIKPTTSMQEMATLRLKVDSANQRIHALSHLLMTMNSRDSLQFYQSFEEQRKELNDILSTTTSVSASNVGNTIGFLALVFGIIAVLLVVFAGAGKFYLDNHISDLTRRYEQRFAATAKVMEVSVHESRGNFYMSTMQYPLASEVFEKILTLDSNNYYAHEQLGFLYLGDILNKPESAVHHNREAIRLRNTVLLPYVNLQVALDHAHHPLPEQEEAFNKAIQMCNLLGADQMTFGKSKLFFAGKLADLDANRKQDAIRLLQEAIAHLSNVADPSRAAERKRWTDQAQTKLDQLNR